MKSLPCRHGLAESFLESESGLGGILEDLEESRLFGDLRWHHGFVQASQLNLA